MFLKLLDKIKIVLKTIIGLITLIADASTVGILIYKSFSGVYGELTFELILVFLLLVFSLVYISMQIFSYVNQLDLLYQLSKRGHLHSMRMVLLVNKERQKERLPLEADRADFTFEIGSCKNKKSSVSYKHRFFVKKKTPGAVICPAWIFSDMNVVPEKVGYTIMGEDWEKTKPELENIKKNEFSSHNGICKFDWEFGGDVRKNAMEVDLQYTRNDVFLWDQNHTFIIYPDCFFKNIKDVSFAVKVGQGDEHHICSVEVTEINGEAQISKYYKKLKNKLQNGNCVIIKTGEYIKAHKGSVFIITVNVDH